MRIVTTLIKTRRPNLNSGDPGQNVTLFGSRPKMQHRRIRPGLYV